MPKNREEMIKLMARLTDLYQQIENVELDYSKAIVEEHIYGLEYDLLTNLYFSVREYENTKLIKGRYNHA